MKVLLLIIPIEMMNSRKKKLERDRNNYVKSSNATVNCRL